MSRQKRVDDYDIRDFRNIVSIQTRQDDSGQNWVAYRHNLFT